MLRRAALIAWMVSGFGVGLRPRTRRRAPARVKQIFHLNPYEQDFGYSQAVLIDKTLYISGSVAADQSGHLVAPGDMAGANACRLLQYPPHARRTWSELRGNRQRNHLYDQHGRALKASDLRFEYYDKERLPTTSWVQVQRLVDPGFLVQIEVRGPSCPKAAPSGLSESRYCARDRQEIRTPPGGAGQFRGTRSPARRPQRRGKRVSARHARGATSCRPGIPPCSARR